jgi:GNAT superfamily N-acetyltransferase
MPTDILIRQMRSEDIDAIVRTFAAWNKTRSQYENYLAEQQRGERDILVAFVGDRVVGYGTIVWKPIYEHFRENDIPEIIDLNVITEFQGRGVGSAIISAAEQFVVQHGQSRLGISVVQTKEYVAANRLYPHLGFVPDGHGVKLFDNQLHLIKKLDVLPIATPPGASFSIRVPLKQSSANKAKSISRWVKQSLKRIGSGAEQYR